MLIDFGLLGLQIFRQPHSWRILVESLILSPGVRCGSLSTGTVIRIIRSGTGVTRPFGNRTWQWWMVLEIHLFLDYLPWFTYFKITVFLCLVRHLIIGHLILVPSHGTFICYTISIWLCCAWTSLDRFHHRFIGADVRAGVAGKRLAVHGCAENWGESANFSRSVFLKPWSWDVADILQYCWQHLDLFPTYAAAVFRYQGAMRWIMWKCCVPHLQVSNFYHVIIGGTLCRMGRF